MNAAVIVAAGKGTRMGPGLDKIFLEVSGLPIVGHAWKRFEQAPSIQEIILVIRPGLESAFKEIAHSAGFKKPWRMVHGGTERQDSVWNGLQALSAQAELVAIHDAARPCTSIELIEKTLQVAAVMGASVAAQPSTDTVKLSEDGRTISQHMDRTKVFAVQTPQTFRVQVIREALQCVRARGVVVTDDTAACALINQVVELVISLSPNPKVTHPSDLEVIRRILEDSDRI